MFKMIIDGYGTTQIANIFTDEHIPTPAMRNRYQTNALSYQYGYWSPVNKCTLFTVFFALVSNSL